MYGKRILNYFLRKMTEKAKTKFQQQTGQTNTSHDKTGHTRVNKSKKKNQRNKKEPVGEYVDFEEVE
jgi:hypothetical protein